MLYPGWKVILSRVPRMSRSFQKFTFVLGSRTPAQWKQEHATQSPLRWQPAIDEIPLFWSLLAQEACLSTRSSSGCGSSKHTHPLTPFLNHFRDCFLKPFLDAFLNRFYNRYNNNIPWP